MKANSRQCVQWIKNCLLKRRDSPIDMSLWRGQIIPRSQLVVCSAKFWIALAGSVIGCFLIAYLELPVSGLEVSKVASIGLSFASIALGGCFSTCVLALALPDNERIRRWATTNGEVKGSSVFSDLVFVLIWACIAQLWLIVCCVVAITIGGNYSVLPPNAPWWQHISIFLGLNAFMYAALELYVVVETLMSLAVVVMWEEKELSKRKG